MSYLFKNKYLYSVLIFYLIAFIFYLDYLLKFLSVYSMVLYF